MRPFLKKIAVRNSFKTLLCLILISAAAQSQTIDTVSIGPSYSNQVYYSLENGIQSSTVKNDWDIAFETGTSMGISILINAATGTELFVYPGDTTDWSSLDTTGMRANWTRRYNSDTSWSFGAFAQDQSGFFVGWGTYNMITHVITGDKVFVIKLSNGVYQKIWIKSLTGGVYTFRHATLNNSMDMIHSVKKADYSTRNFAYFSLQNHIAQDKEPPTTDWDLFFGQYTAFIPSAYLVTGILQNNGVRAEKAYPVNDPTTYTDHSAFPFQKEINTIGYDWKTFNMSTMDYEIADSTVYFVHTATGDIWKMVFLDFEGSSTGNVIFTKEHLRFAGIDDAKQLAFQFYPNPASDVLNIVLPSEEKFQMDIIDLSGKLVYQKVISSPSPLISVHLPVLQDGLYVIRLSNPHGSASRRLMIRQ